MKKVAGFVELHNVTYQQHQSHVAVSHLWWQGCLVVIPAVPPHWLTSPQLPCSLVPTVARKFDCSYFKSSISCDVHFVCHIMIKALAAFTKINVFSVKEKYVQGLTFVLLHLQRNCCPSFDPGDFSSGWLDASWELFYEAAAAGCSFCICSNLKQLRHSVNLG